MNGSVGEWRVLRTFFLLLGLGAAGGFSAVSELVGGGVGVSGIVAAVLLLLVVVVEGGGWVRGEGGAGGGVRAGAGADISLCFGFSFGGDDGELRTRERTYVLSSSTKCVVRK